MRQTTLASSPVQVISNHGFAEMRHNSQTNQNSLHALKPFSKGEVISEFSAGLVCNEPNYLTVQTGVSSHITLMPQFLQYINHSCEPNVFFNTTSLQVTALKSIEPDEEFSFFYPSTEWDMAQPFYCYCGSNGCLQNIRGARYLSPAHIKKYKLTDFIKQQLQITNP